MGVEKGSDDSLKPEQKEILDRLVRRFFFDGGLLGSFGGVADTYEYIG
jgi:hypothetical protein